MTFKQAEEYQKILDKVHTLAKLADDLQDETLSHNKYVHSRLVDLYERIGALRKELAAKIIEEAKEE